MKTRMQPIGSAWSKLPRLVRDLSKDLGKPMDLRMIGADTEIDRQVLELVRDPLTHMVRNSADHGLELPHERRAANKPEVGTITLTAFHEGGHITVEIADDGRGLPLDRIREKILAKRLATRSRAGCDERGGHPAVHLPRGLLDGRTGYVGIWPWRRDGRGQDEHRADRRDDRAAQPSRRRHDLHHQDPFDPGDRLRLDRGKRGRAFCHRAEQRGRAGPCGIPDRVR